MSSDPITGLNAALEGRYRIDRQLGEGGMATVYLAEDVKHQRSVALKVLKPELAAVVGADRFLAEIKTTANLQHPHILPLFDSGEADGLLFYVMPYVAGESLRERLEREGPLPVDDAVRIASRVAEALDHAHREGVVHRDMKPANILLRDGQPLVADFGIALAMGAAGGSRLTETGLSVGTPQYMSPEQATGSQNVGPASDIYALGCILYESLVGEPPYTGSTPQAVLGKIITGEAPSASAVRPSVPRHVDATIARALEKLPADRFRRAADFAEALGDPGFRHGVSNDGAVGRSVRIQKRVVQGLAASTVMLALLSTWLLLSTRRAPFPAASERFAIDVPAATASASTGVSTEGSALVFVGPGQEERQQLWLRRWHDLTSSPIPGTGGSNVGMPAVSPDATEVAFVADGALRVIPLDGGVARMLADSISCCPRWGSDGFVYYTGLGWGIERTPAAGGPAETVTRPVPGDRVHADLQMLPGGQAAVFTVQRGGETSAGRIEMISLDTGDRTVVVPRGVHPHYVSATGQLLFGTRSGEIMAAPFDIDRRALTGTATRLVDGVFTPGQYPRTTFGLSAAGRLVYLRARGGREDRYEFVWLDRNGVPTPVDPTLDLHPSNVGWSLAPDESRFAFNSEVDGNNDIYVKQLPDGPVERITTSPGADLRPFWTSDGERIWYFYSTGPVLDSIDLWSIRTDGTRPELVLDGPRGLVDGASSPDGDYLVLRTTNSPPEPLGVRGLFSFRPGVDSAATPLLNDPAYPEQAPVVSPSGRWLAYTSTRTGRLEVYVNHFPDVERPRVTISTEGGASPEWGAGDSELFYWSRGTIVSVSLDPTTGAVLSREELFTVPGEPSDWIAGFEVTSDGRFLMARQRAGDDPAVPQIVVVQNFVEELRSLVRD